MPALTSRPPLCPVCSVPGTLETPTLLKGTYTFKCPTCGFVWTETQRTPRMSF
jgi:transposase-like protein